jgi:hypothetical protein
MRCLSIVLGLVTVAASLATAVVLNRQPLPPGIYFRNYALRKPTTKDGRMLRLRFLWSGNHGEDEAGRPGESERAQSHKS